VLLEYNKLKLLSLLYKSEFPIAAYNIYKDLRLTYDSYMNIIISLLNDHYIIENNNVIEITPQGIDYLLSEKNSYFSSGKKQWREVPHDFQCIKIVVGSYYIPSIKKL